MVHFALICPPFFSHIRVFETLAAELTGRGHRATFVLNGGAEGFVRLADCAVRSPRPGSAAAARDMDRFLARAADPTGPLGVLRTVADTARLTDELCRAGPALLREIGAQAILGDQMEPAAGLLAAHLGLPLVSVACALPINAEPAMPLPFLSWAYDPSEKGLKRNRGGVRVADLLLTRQRRTIAAWARRFGLPDRGSAEACLSNRLQISQMVPGFDFPRLDPRAPAALGPIRLPEEGEPSLGFPLDPARPLVFASLGTLQGHRLAIFRAVAKACREIGAQCLVAHCGRLSPAEAATVGADVVTDFAPQRAVLKRAAVCVTHAGLNTVLDSLEAGVPLLAIPIAFDQPGIAARIVHHGAGERLSRVLLSAPSVRSSLERLLAQSSFRDQARAIGREIGASGGASVAADMIEEAVGRERSLGGGRAT